MLTRGPRRGRQARWAGGRRRGKPAQGQRRHAERGASALEMALVAPGLIFLIFLTIQGALYFYGRNVAIQAAREGVSQLRLAEDRATFEAVKGEVVTNTERFASQVGRGGLLGPAATPSYDDGAGRVRVEVSGRVITLLPGLDLEVTEAAEGPVERWGESDL